MEPRIESFLEALRTAPASVVLVSNEVGSGVVPPYPAGRRFRDALGELNQRVAAIADNVVLMVAGLPLALKGSDRSAAMIAFMVAGTASGVGKTTVALTLMAMLRERGFSRAAVQVRAGLSGCGAP